MTTHISPVEIRLARLVPGSLRDAGLNLCQQILLLVSRQAPKLCRFKISARRASSLTLAAVA
jgi:hypothetical protein